MKKTKVLIVGAGPVGLAAALFLSSDQTIDIDIIDQLTETKNIVESKALAINPRTMTLLHGYQSQAKLLQLAIKISKFKLKTSQKTSLQNNVEEILKNKTKFPNIYIYPQHGTEQVFEEELNKLGINVRRGVKLQKIIKNQPNDVLVKLSGNQKEVGYNIVLGADGARSTVRKLLDIPFPGETLDQKIYLVDYQIEGQYRDYFQANFGNPDVFIIIPMNKSRCRFIGNFPDLQSYAKKVCKIKLGKKYWQSSFKLNNRYVEKMNIGGIYLAGDSAHVHAPIGGRGMNLGIEDAFVFAQLLKAKRLSEYNELRIPVIKQFVERIKKASKNLEYKKTLLRSVLPYIGTIVNYFAKDSMIEFAAGLDHQIPFLPRL